MISSAPADPQINWLNCIGDSITAPYPTVTYDMTAFPYLVKAGIGGICRERNLGVAGNTTTQMLARISQAVSPIPSVVVIYGGINDLGGGISDATTTSNLNAMIAAIRSAGCDRIMLCNIHTITAVSDSNYDGKRAAILASASSSNVPVCDFHAVTLINPTDYVDGLHLTATGIQKLATALKSALDTEGWSTVLHG